MNKQPKSLLRIGNAQGFWGDRPKAAKQLLADQPDLDFLTLDYLSEVSLSIMAIQRNKNDQEGYAKDFLDTLKSLIPFWSQGSTLKVISNAGGLNPLACGYACRQLLNDAGFPSLKIGIVNGDNVLELLQKSELEASFANLDTGESLETVKNKLMTANAYLGSQPIVDLLKDQADIIITGRIADPSLTVAPCIAHFGWSYENYDLLAQATVAGHLLECGTQVTGGVSTRWLDHISSIAEAARWAFPVVEISSDGTFVVTKPQNGGGRVDEQTVKEQLLYEIGDPASYFSPDVIASFLNLQLSSDGKDRIRISGALGRAPTETYKVSATYTDGYRTEAMLGIFGTEAAKKAKLCGEIILKRVEDCGFILQRSIIECLGTGDLVGEVIPNKASETLECVLRVAVADPRYEALECFAKEIASLVTNGPQGVTGYTSGRPHIRQVFGYWPCLIKTSHVHPRIQMV
jgi:hypothetical protein